MLLAYGFPPFPYPIPSGMDPAMYLHMLTTDPLYKAKYKKDRAEKEKASKEQFDRDLHEMYRKAGFKLPEEGDLSKAWYDLFQRIEEDSPLEQELRACLMKWYKIRIQIRIKQFESNPQAVMDAIKRGELKL